MQNGAGITPIEQYVIDRVKAIRSEKKMSQVDLSNKLGLSSGFVGNVESSKRRAKYNLNHLNKIAEVFACSFHEIFPKYHLKQDEPS